MVVIFINWPQIPQNLSFDEVEFAKLALSLQNRSFTIYSNLATGHSTLYFYILLASMKIFGITRFALRLPSAIFGIFSIVVIYLIFGQIFTSQDKKRSLWVIFLSILTLATSHWFVNFARFSFEATLLLLLELITILFLFYYRQKNRLIFLALSGVMAGLAFNSYTPGRIFFLLPLLYLIIRKAPLKIKLTALFSYGVPFLLLALPLSLYLLTHQDTRLTTLAYLQNANLNWLIKVQYFSQNLLSTLGMFVFRGDLNGRQNYPGKLAINPVMGIFFLVGLLIAFKNRHRFFNIFFIMYLIISLTPALFTYPNENPHMLRTFTALPGVVYFISQSLIYFLKKRTRFYKILAMLILVIGLSCLYELRTYFVYQTQVFPQAFEMKGQLIKLVSK